MTRNDARTIADLEGICWRRLREYLPRVSSPAWDDAVEGLSLPRIIPLIDVLERCARLRGELALLWPDEADEPAADVKPLTEPAPLGRPASPYSEEDGTDPSPDDPAELPF